MLNTENLVVRFGGVFALGGVDFAMTKGEVHCLVGPNGAGKSTFFKVVTGQIAPTSGRVSLGGSDITGEGSAQIVRRGIGIKMQTPQLFDDMTVEDTIWLGAYRGRGKDHARRRTAELLDELRLGEVARAEVGKLAHGLRQRVEIASVLAGDPELILLDEPAAGMSDADVDFLAALILRLRGQHSFLVVEHDMRFIRMVADRVTVFHNGKIFLEGRSDAVLSDQGVKDIYLGKGKAHA
ncbi:ABC transporter ATP-binding protein [Cereibacter sphaeroides]|nr:ABC transporter ATP-binding protein [Cereibacter sphaeroides]